MKGRIARRRGLARSDPPSSTPSAPPPVVHSPLVILGNHTVLLPQPYNEPCRVHVPDGRGVSPENAR